MKKLMIIIFIALASGHIFGLTGAAIDFKAKDISGQSIELSKFKGKVVVLDFWATWCRPCIKEIPNLKKIYNDHKDDDFEIISIALERKPSEFAINFVKENEMDWIHVIDKESGRKIATDYRIQYIPSMYVVNKKGEIVASGLRGEKLRKKISGLLK